MKNMLFALIILAPVMAIAQVPENWTKKELMEPAELARMIQSGEKQPLIISVGPGALIPGSVDIGMTKDTQNLVRLNRMLDTISRESKIVIYCGCCPFAHCPNVRPAIAALKQLKFRDYYLLNLPKNLKTDWLDKGYPRVN